MSFTSPYTYELGEGEIAELVSSSQTITLETNNNIITIITNYSEITQGFGEEYWGEEKAEFLIDLSQLNLPAQQGDLIITLVYNNEEIISTTKEINLEQPIEQENITEPENITEEPIEESEENITEESPLFAGRGIESLWSTGNSGAGLTIAGSSNAIGLSDDLYANARGKKWTTDQQAWVFIMNHLTR